MSTPNHFLNFFHLHRERVASSHTCRILVQRPPRTLREEQDRGSTLAMPPCSANVRRPWPSICLWQRPRSSRLTEQPDGLIRPNSNVAPEHEPEAQPDRQTRGAARATTAICLSRTSRTSAKRASRCWCCLTCVLVCQLLCSRGGWCPGVLSCAKRVSSCVPCRAGSAVTWNQTKPPTQTNPSSTGHMRSLLGCLHKKETRRSADPARCISEAFLVDGPL